VVVGSYVDLSARQLAVLLRDRSTAGIELDVPHLLDIDAPDAVEGVVRRIVRAVDAGKTPVVYTTRSLVTEAGGHRSIGRRVSEALVSVVRALPFSPSFVIAKGGITSLTIMRDGFGVKAGRVAGPVMPGVPVVRIPLPGDGTSEVDYVIFPGNVGADDDLYNLYQTYTQRSDAR
ncbi:MAG: hypothetical protein MI724_08580, partial [Spirochaetales bacterium]|nr:hypothetical protein [Spirochaetales bacterium]